MYRCVNQYRKRAKNNIEERAQARLAQRYFGKKRRYYLFVERSLTLANAQRSRLSFYQHTNRIIESYIDVSKKSVWTYSTKEKYKYYTMVLRYVWINKREPKTRMWYLDVIRRQRVNVMWWWYYWIWSSERICEVKEWMNEWINDRINHGINQSIESNQNHHQSIELLSILTGTAITRNISAFRYGNNKNLQRHHS